MDRRSFLVATAAGAVGALAGCTARDADPGDGTATPGPGTVRATIPGGDGASPSTPQYQGDATHGGRYDGPGPADNVETYWRRTPSRYRGSQPVVADDRVYVGFAGTLVCLERATGDTLWTADVGHDSHGTPAVSDGTVYLTVWNGGEGVDRGLAAVDAASGDVQWRGVTDADVTTSPAVTGGGVFVGGGHETRLVAAFDHDGTERWHHRLGEYASTPAVADGTVVYGAGDARVVAFDAASGEREWSVGTDGETTAPPTVTGGAVLVGTRAGTLYALERTDGRERWRVDVGGPVRRSVAVADGRVVVPAESGLFAFDLDGEPLWSTDDLDGPTAPVVAGDTVYLGVYRTLHALSLDAGETLWTVRTRERTYSDVVAGGIRSAPSVAGGVVFVATQAGDVYAIGET